MCACSSALTWVCRQPSLTPGSGARALREENPEVLSPGLWNRVRWLRKMWTSLGDGGVAATESACKPAFGSSWGSLPGGVGWFYSEAPRARGT